MNTSPESPLPWVRRLALGVCLTVGVAVAAPQDEPEPPASTEPVGEPAGETERRSVDELSPDERRRALREVLDSLAAGLGKVERLRARFEQRKYLAVFEREVVSSGSLAIDPPSKLRWEYEKPVRSVLTVNGERARMERISRRGEKSVRRYSLSEDRITAITVQQVFLWTRGDFDAAAEDYHLGLVSFEPLVISATPKDERMRRVVERVELHFTAKCDALAQVVLDEEGDGLTRIRFTDIEVDPDLPDDLFRIED